jgi:hypothetical protein
MNLYPSGFEVDRYLPQGSDVLDNQEAETGAESPEPPGRRLTSNTFGGPRAETSLAAVTEYREHRTVRQAEGGVTAQPVDVRE